ncbi:MAG: ABC transporter permease [Defluviitaleaceae bacterium]|nr:ABC transporter permease [Defluviitaleaceae bacterium]
MMRLMRADMYRVLRGKAIYITFAVMIANAILTVFVLRTAAIQIGVIDDPNMFEAAEYLSGSVAAQMALDAMNILPYLFLPLIIGVAMASFSSDAVKNELSTGISRAKFYLSKWTLSSILCVAMMALHMVLFVVFATINDGLGHWGDGFVSGILQAFAAQTLMALAFNSIGMFLCFVTRRTAAVTGLYLAFILVPQMIVALLSIAFPGAMDYFFYDLGAQFNIFAQMATLSNGEIARGLAVGLGYLVIPLLAGVALFKKAEIK